MSPTSDSDPRLRLLVLGGGAVVSDLHAPALDAMGWLRSALIVDPSTRHLAKIAGAFPDARVRECDFETALGEIVPGSFDAALIALPNSLHAEGTRRAILSGLHVLCEKPLALDAATCRDLGAFAERHGRLLSVAMVRRFSPSFLALRNAIAQGLIGAVEGVEMEEGNRYAWSADSETSFRRDQGGILANMGVHFLDYLESLLGQLTPLSYSDDARGGIEANCEIHLATANGKPVRIKLSYTHGLRNRLRVLGEKGELSVSCGNFEHCEIHSRDGRVTGRLAPAVPFTAGCFRPTFESCFAEQLSQFAQRVRSGGEPLVSAKAAARTADLIDWAYARRAAPPVHALSAHRPRLEAGRAVVTGGTGFIGGALIERLTELGFVDVIVPVRSYRTCANAARFPVTFQRTDLLDLAAVAALVCGARYVFHLAVDAERAIIGAGTRNIVRAAIDAGVEAVVVFSTTSVYGHPEGFADEETPHAPQNEYARAKSRMEDEVLAMARRSRRTRIVIVQPGHVIGPRGPMFTEAPRRLFEEGRFAWVDGGHGNVDYIFVDNLVDLTLLAAGVQEAAGQRFIGIDGVTTWRELLGPLFGAGAEQAPSISSTAPASASSRRGSTVKDIARACLMSQDFIAAVSGHWLLGRIKKALTRRFRRECDVIRGLRPRNDPIRPAVPQMVQEPPAWLAELFGPNKGRLSNEKARRVLGFRSAVGLAEAQRRCIAWLTELGLPPRDA